MATKKTPLTTKQLMVGFAVGHMTIYNWRHGTARKNPLPHAVDDAKHVTFDPAEVKAWAKEHGVSFDLVKALAPPAVESLDGKAVVEAPKPTSASKAKAKAAAVIETVKRKASPRADKASAAMVTAKKKTSAVDARAAAAA